MCSCSCSIHGGYRLLFCLDLGAMQCGSNHTRNQQGHTQAHRVSGIMFARKLGIVCLFQDAAGDCLLGHETGRSTSDHQASCLECSLAHGGQGHTHCGTHATHNADFRGCAAVHTLIAQFFVAGHTFVNACTGHGGGESSGHGVHTDFGQQSGPILQDHAGRCGCHRIRLEGIHTLA